jgi:hypothetical protein
MSARASTTDLPPKPEAHAAGARLHRKPVHGSVVLGLMPSQPAPRAAWAYLYPVSDRSPSRARHDTEWFLAKCREIPDGFGEIAVLLVSELVTNAYKAMLTGPLTGIACIDLSLRLFRDHLLIEVIDSSPDVPVPKLAQDVPARGAKSRFLQAPHPRPPPRGKLSNGRRP